MTNLPDYCYDTLETTGELIRIDSGEPGYTTLSRQGMQVTGAEAVEMRDNMNRELNVTPAQRSAMKHGSMFGWHVPAADPKNEINQLAE